MINHYNAFISYKHAPLDNKMAAHIQSALEHFKIPRKIQKQTGMKRIQRVFRDKDELPITSDLTDTISQALENSDYLIVICSKSTKQSHWVPREIEYFLRSHTMDHILTVLIEGEPEESIPDILCSEERVIRLEDGTVRPISVTCEPLSCDFRLPKHKADKVELPRLAACLIGCSYDELINRRRQYRIKRAIAAAAVLFTVAVAFAGYLLYNQMRLKRAYKETLQSQAVNLSNQAVALFNDGDRVGALQLTLTALPPESDAPITAEATRALVTSTYAYQPAHSIYQDEDLKLEWNYHMNAYIEDMILSPEGQTIACLDSAQMLSIWNTRTHEQIIDHLSLSGEFEGMKYVDDYSFVAWSRDELVYYDLVHHDIAWKLSLYEHDGLQLDGYTLNSIHFNKTALEFPKDSDYVYIFASISFLFQDLSYNEDVSGCYMLKLSKANGEIVDMRRLGESYVSRAGFSPDGRKCAYIIGELGIYAVSVLDMQTKEVNSIPVENSSVCDFFWVDESRLVFSIENNPDSIIWSTPNYTALVPQYFTASLLNTDSMQIGWSTQFEYYEYSSKVLSTYIPASNKIAYARGDSLQFVDCSTGEVSSSKSFNRVIIDLEKIGSNGELQVFLTDGSVAYINSENTADVVYLWYDYQWMGTLLKVIPTDGGTFFLRHDHNDVQFYSERLGDPRWEPLEDAPSVSRPDILYYKDDQYLIYTYIQSNAENQIEHHCIAYDLNTAAFLWDILLTDFNITNDPLLLSVQDDVLSMAVMKDDYQLFIRKISMEDGEVIEDEFVSNKITSITFSFGVVDEYAVYIYNEKFGEPDSIAICNLENGDKEFVSLPFDELSCEMPPMYFPEQDVIFYFDKEEGTYVIDSNRDASTLELPDDWTTKQIVPNQDGGKWLISSGRQIIVTDEEFEEDYTLDLLGKTALGMFFYQAKGEQDQILVATQDGALLRYDSNDGEFLGSSQIEVVNDVWFSATMSYFPEQDMLTIQNHFITDIIDTNSWLQIARVDNSVGYHEESDRFFAFDGGTNRMGVMPHYSTEDLVEMANEIIGDFEMSDEFKKKYDIN